MTFPLPAYAASTSRNAGSDILKRPLICRQGAPAALGARPCNSVPPRRWYNSFVSKHTNKTDQIDVRLDNRVFAIVSPLVKVVLRPGVTVIAHLEEKPRQLWWRGVPQITSTYTEEHCTSMEEELAHCSGSPVNVSKPNTEGQAEAQLAWRKRAARLTVLPALTSSFEQDQLGCPQTGLSTK